MWSYMVSWAFQREDQELVHVEGEDDADNVTLFLYSWIVSASNTYWPFWITGSQMHKKGWQWWSWKHYICRLCTSWNLFTIQTVQQEDNCTQEGRPARWVIHTWPIICFWSWMRVSPNAVLWRILYSVYLMLLIGFSAYANDLQE